jgi:hypothetical protein
MNITTATLSIVAQESARDRLNTQYAMREQEADARGRAEEDHYDRYR